MCFLAIVLRRMSHVTSPTGPVLGAHPRRWAVVGDVLNHNKPAYDVAARLEACGRHVARVSPYCKSGEVATSLEAVPGEIDAVNLIISPKLGVDVLEAAAARGIKCVAARDSRKAPRLHRALVPPVPPAGTSSFNQVRMVARCFHAPQLWG